MLVLAAQGVALSVLRTGWVLRNDVKSQPGDGCKSLAGILLYITDRDFLFKQIDLTRQCFKLLCEQRVSKICIAPSFMEAR